MEDNQNEVLLDDVNENTLLEVNQENTENVEENISDTETKIYTEEEVEEIKSQIAKDYESKSQKIFNARWAREKSNYEKENAQLLQIEDVLKGQLGAKDRNELMQKLSDFYQVDIKSSQNSKLSDRDERILAKADAQEFKELGVDEMVSEANRIASIPKDQRSLRDEVVFETLAQEITEQRNINELKEKGYDLAVLDDKKFKDFRSKLNYKTTIAEAVDMYKLLTKGQAIDIEPNKPIKPASAGSTKSNITQNKIKEFYTREESLQYDKKDFDENPELWQAMLKSMPKW